MPLCKGWFLLKEIYLDNSATTAVDDTVSELIFKCMRENYGNPSSLHKLGLAAETLLSKSRSDVAAALDCAPNEVCFVASGTEANNTAIFGSARLKRRRGDRIIISSYEHPSVDEPAKRLAEEGFDVVRIEPEQDGKISVRRLLEECNEKTVLVSVMLVNNEIGAVNDILALCRAVKSRCPNALFHCDAVQGFGKIPISCKRLGVDTLSVSGHKIHAPKGVGALFVKKGVRLPPLLCGGGQESGLRSSTEATSLIAGFALAAKSASENIPQNLAHAHSLNRLLKSELEKLPQVEINSPDDALAYIVNISAGKVRSEIMLHYLESHGIYVSSGSACSKGAVSRTLSTYGLPPSRIDSALRISFSKHNTEEDILTFVAKLSDGLSNILTN